MSLIVDAYLKKLVQDCFFHATDEWATSTFWVQYLSKYEFTGKEWIVDGQVPPKPGSLLRMDLGVKYFEHPSYETVILVIAELKHAAASDEEIRKAEMQGLEKARIVCEKVSFVYVQTAFGISARLWRYDAQQSSLEPLYGSRNYGDRMSYIAADSAEAATIKRGYDTMKKVRPTLAIGQSASIYGSTVAIGTTSVSAPSTLSSAVNTGSWVVPASSSDKGRWEYDSEDQSYDYYPNNDAKTPTGSQQKPPLGIWIWFPAEKRYLKWNGTKWESST